MSSTDQPHAWQLLIDQAREKLVTIQEQARQGQYHDAARGCQDVAAAMLLAMRNLNALQAAERTMQRGTDRGA